MSKFSNRIFAALMLAGAAVAQIDAPAAKSTIGIAQVDEQLQTGKYDDALHTLDLIVQQHLESRRLERRYGIAYYGKGDLRKAIPYLQTAITADANDREATQLLGLAFFALGRPAEAIPYLEKVREWFPSAHLDASYYLGTAYLQSNRLSDAAAAFADVYGVRKDSAAGDLMMARMLLRQEFEPVAEEYARKAIQKDPALPLAHFLVGEIYLYKSDPAKAIIEFEAELKINPAHAPTYVRLADAYLRSGRFNDAERVLSRSIYLDSTSSAAYMLLGRALLRKNDVTRAAAAFERAIALDPNNYLAHHQLGQALVAAGRRAQGEAELRRAQELQNQQKRLPVEKQ